MVENTSIRGEMMEVLKNKFSVFSFWKRIEVDIALRCSNLPEPTNKEKKDEFVKQLKSLKLFMLKQEVLKKDLEFIDEEIELHEQTRMISLYEEKDDSIEPSVIAGYSRLGKGSEGVVAIPQPYNYSQLSKLTNGVYKKTGLVKFYISKEQTIYGQIVAEVYEHSQQIPIATVIETKKVDKESGEKLRRILLFGQRYSKTEHNIIKEINLPFYVYRFITEKNSEFILLTSTRCEIGDYFMTGVQTHCDDYKMLTDSAKLPTKLPFFFAQKIQNRIIKFKDREEFKFKLRSLYINRKDFFDYPFTATKNGLTRKLLHPKWYKWLIWSWLTHRKKGLMNDYPFHLMIIGQPGAGKSFLLNGLFNKSKETREVFAGAGSTLKSLVPSFKYSPARLGYLAESNRFSFCDEFLRCLTNTKTSSEGSQREESVAVMNDLLEHQKREVGSGVSRVKVNMTSRVIAATNPVKGIQNVSDLIKRFDASFLSRWIIYYQTEEHEKLVKDSNDSKLEFYDFKIPINDWISFLDYLHSFSAEYDLERVLKIYNSIPNILSEDLNNHYNTRHKHHIECLMDGIIKTRCFLERDMSFKAKEQDYEVLKEVWTNIIKSWINSAQIQNIDIKERVFYLPENSKFIYEQVSKLKKPVRDLELQEMILDYMSKEEFTEAINILISNEVLKQSNGMVIPWWMGENN